MGDPTNSLPDPDSALTFIYDNIGRRLTASTNGSPSQPASTLTYTYDGNGNRLTMNDGGAVDTVYAYDTLNRLTSIANPALQATTFEYDVLSRRTKTNHHNGTVTDFAYDAASRLTSLSHSLGVSTISSFAYTYNAVNNRDTLTTSRPTFATAQTNFNYGYDDLDRLVQATRPITGDPDETFTYDPVGNRLQRDGDLVNNTFDDANRLLEDANFTYTYDNNGNTTSKTDKATLEVTEYTYDPENRLIGITERVNAGGAITKTVTYSYDATGRRIQKNVDGVITAYIYDGPDILFEYDGASVQQARYTHGPSVDEPLVMERGGQAYCYHADGLGSVTEISDSVGSTIQAYLYDSYGNITQTNGVLENPYTYTGRELDTESGLYYYRARYYNGNTGHFLNEDPIGLRGGINAFAYVANNPINSIDPSGLDLILIGEGGSAGKMFNLAGKTWANNNSGTHEIVPVNSGKKVIEAMANYAAKNGGNIDGLQYFGHSSNYGLLVSQGSGINSFYTDWYKNQTKIGANGAVISGVKPSWFKKTGNITFHGWNTGSGNSSFAKEFASHVNKPVNAATGPTVFSGVNNGTPGQGLPSIIPENYSGGVYLVPQYPNKGFKTFQK